MLMVHWMQFKCFIAYSFWCHISLWIQNPTEFTAAGLRTECDCERVWKWTKQISTGKVTAIRRDIFCWIGIIGRACDSNCDIGNDVRAWKRKSNTKAKHLAYLCQCHTVRVQHILTITITNFRFSAAYPVIEFMTSTLFKASLAHTKIQDMIRMGMNLLFYCFVFALEQQLKNIVLMFKSTETFHSFLAIDW